MTKAEILEAINATIVTNGVKGITAESLANILTEIVNAAPEGDLKYAIERTFYPTYEMYYISNNPVENVFEITEEQREYNKETLSLVMAGKAVVLVKDGNSFSQAGFSSEGDEVTGAVFMFDAAGQFAAVEINNNGDAGIFSLAESGLQDFIYVPASDGVLSDEQKAHNRTFFSASLYQENLRRVKIVDKYGSTGYTTSYSSIVICGYNEVTYFEGTGLKKASLLIDGSVTVTTIGTLNAPTA